MKTNKQTKRQNKTLSKQEYKTKTKTNKTKQSKPHHYTQANSNNVNKTCAILHTAGGKDEPNIVFMRKS